MPARQPSTLSRRHEAVLWPLGFPLQIVELWSRGRPAHLQLTAILRGLRRITGRRERRAMHAPHTERLAAHGSPLPVQRGQQGYHASLVSTLFPAGRSRMRSSPQHIVSLTLCSLFVRTSATATEPEVNFGDVRNEGGFDLTWPKRRF